MSNQINPIGKFQIDTRGRVRTAHNGIVGLTLQLRRTWYTDPPPAGDPPPAVPPKTPPVTQPPPEDAPTLTQKQADAIIGSRVKEASAASLSALAKELGFDTVDAMKAAAQAAKKRQDDELSASEKLQKELDDMKSKFAAETKRAADAEAARIADKVNGKIETLAAAAKAHTPDDVVLFLRTNKGEALTAAVSADGVVDPKAIEKLITDVKKERPHWFGATGPGSPSNNNGTAPAPDPKQWGDKPLARL